MPTHDPRLALTPDVISSVVADAVTPRDTAGDRIGLEVEFFPVVTAPPTRRLPIADPTDGPPGVRRVLDDACLPALGRLPGGTRVTVEPGGQVELSTTCCPDVESALAEVDRGAATLAARFDHHGVALASAGLDLWHDVASVPQQLTEARYPAMAAYLASRSPAGATMMRHTCALQLSLDLGSRPSVAHERWIVANLLAPIATATFANSPSRDGTVRSRRSLAWQALDPTRTGFPRRLLAGEGDLATQLVTAALEADVLLFPSAIDPSTGRPTAATPGRPGHTFGAWARHGDPQHGWPTVDDLRHHLTTLFHEVRPRGPIELRSVDAVPHDWRAVPVVLHVGALYDAAARGRILEVLGPHLAELPGLLRRAATVGVSDPALCALAVEAWSFALAGARRLTGIDARHLDRTEAFLDRFTLRGRCPADELAEAFRRSPVDALARATEPVPATHRSLR